MQIVLYNFTKKDNSTIIPTSGGTSVNVVLKEDTSVLNPTFILTSTGSLNQFNYVAWNYRFYFVTDIIKRNHNTIEIQCNVDVLGTWRTNILNSSQFIDRSASSYNLNLKDSLIGSTENVIQTLTAEENITGWSASGKYVLRLASALGGDFLVYGTRAQINSLLDFAFSTSISDQFTDSWVQFLFDPMKYILDIMWFPVDTIPTSGSRSVFLGYYQTGQTLNTVSDSLYDPTFNITIPSTSYYGDFRDYDPQFTKVILFLPAYGTYELPPEYIGQTIGCKYVVDFMTGGCNILIKVNNSTIADLACMLGVPIQINASEGQNVKTRVDNAISAVGNVMTGNVIGLAENVSTMVTSSFQPIINTKGSIGNKALMLSEGSIKATVIRKGSSGVPLTRCGRVLNETRTLSTLSGFCKCINGNVEIHGLESERQIINNYLNQGFYIE